MRAVAILAHLMDENGNLGSESQARLKKAVQLHQQNPFDLFLTTGWNYRKDCPRMIGAVMAEHLSEAYGIDENLIVADFNSRDTVGDAFFLRKNAIVPMNIRDLVAVTSDYHVDRTEAIFRALCPEGTTLNVIGAKTHSAQDPTVLAHEKKSLLAFQETFVGVDFSDDFQVCRALRTKHPFYNGEIHEQLRC